MAGKKGQRRTKSHGLRARAWWVIRRNRAITVQDVLLSIADGTEKQSLNNIRCFFIGLMNAGILKRELIDDGKLTSNGTYRYFLINDLGAKSPVVRKDEVYDPNSEQLLAFRQLDIEEVI